MEKKHKDKMESRNDILKPFKARCNRCGKTQEFIPSCNDPKKWKCKCSECGWTFKPWKPMGKQWEKWK